MITMSISEFKKLALSVIDQVAKTKEEIVITKRGKPLAKVIPFRNSEKQHKPGELSQFLVFEKDIVSPFGEDLWEACR